MQKISDDELKRKITTLNPHWTASQIYVIKT